jgi:hypothetical protein
LPLARARLAKVCRQILVGGEFVGGCTEAFDAFNE